MYRAYTFPDTHFLTSDSVQTPCIYPMKGKRAILSIARLRDLVALSSTIKPCCNAKCFKLNSCILMTLKIN